MAHPPAALRPPFQNSDQWITLFADASFCSSSGAYGWCFWIKHGKPAQTLLFSGGGLGMASSHWAEVEALRQGLAVVSRMDLAEKRVVVQSDCTGALAVIAPDLAALRKLGASAAYSKHVKGHQGHKNPRASVNTTCDTRARAEMKSYRTADGCAPRRGRPSF